MYLFNYQACLTSTFFAVQGAHSKAPSRPSMAGMVPGKGTGDVGHCARAPAVCVPQESVGSHRHALFFRYSAGPPALPAVL